MYSLETNDIMDMGQLEQDSHDVESVANSQGDTGRYNTCT